MREISYGRCQLCEECNTVNAVCEKCGRCWFCGPCHETHSQACRGPLKPGVVGWMIIAVVVASFGSLFVLGACGNLSPEIKAEADIRAEIEADVRVELQAELDLALSKHSSSSSTATGNNSNVINLQLAGGGGVVSLLTMALGAWLGRRTPVKAVKRLVGFIDKAVKPEHREGVRHDQSCYMHRPLREPTKYSSVCTCDPAERLINRIVKRSKA